MFHETVLVNPKFLQRWEIKQVFFTRFLRRLFRKGLSPSLPKGVYAPAVAGK